MLSLQREAQLSVSKNKKLQKKKKLQNTNFHSFESNSDSYHWDGRIGEHSGISYILPNIKFKIKYFEREIQRIKEKIKIYFKFKENNLNSPEENKTQLN